MMSSITPGPETQDLCPPEYIAIENTPPYVTLRRPTYKKDGKKYTDAAKKKPIFIENDNLTTEENIFTEENRYTPNDKEEKSFTPNDKEINTFSPKREEINIFTLYNEEEKTFNQNSNEENIDKKIYTFSPKREEINIFTHSKEENIDKEIIIFSPKTEEINIFTPNNEEEKTFKQNSKEENINKEIHTISPKREEKNIFTPNNEEEKTFNQNNKEENIFIPIKKKEKTFNQNSKEENIFIPYNKKEKIFNQNSKEENILIPSNKKEKTFNQNSKEGNNFISNNKEENIFTSSNKEERTFNWNKKIGNNFTSINKEEKAFNPKNNEKKTTNNKENESNIFHAAVTEPSDKISPKTCKIMRELYGETWKRTPGLFPSKKIATLDSKETESKNLICKKLDFGIQSTVKPTKKPEKNIMNPTRDAYSDGTTHFIASLEDNIPLMSCTLEARMYKSNFKAKREELARAVFKILNENVFKSQLQPTMPILWNPRLTNCAGRTLNRQSTLKGRSSKIELSTKIADSTQRVRDTMAHEMCHAATWLMDGESGHGVRWKSWVAKTLRRYPQFKALPVCHNYETQYKYQYKCSACGYGYNRHSKSINVSKDRCGVCSGSLVCMVNTVKKNGEIVCRPDKPREVKGFALYVQQNYGMVRGNHTPHKDAMKYLGSQFKKLQVQQQSEAKDEDSEPSPDKTAKQL